MTRIDQFQLRFDAEQDRLRLGPSRGPSVRLGLNPFMLHAFCRLLVQAVAHTDWGLGLTLVQAPLDAPRGLIN